MAVAPVIAIDGPAGAGKSTAARNLAKRLRFLLLDTGALYRCLAVAGRVRGLAWDDAAALASLAGQIDIRFATGEAGQIVLLYGRDVSEAIRTPEMSDGAS